MRPLLAILLLALCLACSKTPDTHSSLRDTLAPPDLNAQLLDALELAPAPLKGTTLLGRGEGVFHLEGSTLVWIDPAIGIRLVGLENPTTRRPLDPIPLALLTPKQTPADALLLKGAVVVRSESGPFALELFTEGEPRAWTWQGAFQRGHYDAIYPAGPAQILAWDKARDALDCWTIDRANGTLLPRWQWSLPAPTDHIATAGAFLALAVHNTPFDARGRAKTGSGVMLFGLDDDPTQPTLFDRWAAPSTEPLSGLLWYGRGLIVTQGSDVHLLRRDQRSLLKSLGHADMHRPVVPRAASGRYCWLASDTDMRVLDLNNPAHPLPLAEPQGPITPAHQFVVHRGILWYLEADATGEVGDEQSLALGAPDLAAFPTPVSALRAADLLHRPPHRVGDIELEGHPPPLPADAVIYENHLYVARGELGLAVYALDPDAADPLASARPLESVRLPGEVQQLHVAGHWLYCTNYTAGFQIVDLRDPAHPTVVSRRSGLREGTGLLQAQGRRLLAASTQLTLGRITQPGVTFVDLRLDLPGHAEGLAVDGDRSYVACGDGGLFVYDSGEGHPLIVLNHLRTGHAWGRLAARDHRLYAARDRTQLVALDMTRSANPDSIQVADLGAPITALALDGDRLLVALRLSDAWGELRAYDLAADGSFTWRTSDLLPGPISNIRPSTTSAPALVTWGRSPEQAGVFAVPVASATGFRVIGQLPIPPAPGPWLSDGARFWTSSDTQIEVRDASDPGFPVLASAAIDPSTSAIPRAGEVPMLYPSEGGVLATHGSRALQVTADGSRDLMLHTWPMGETESLLDAGGDSVLVWQTDHLQVAIMQLFEGERLLLRQQPLDGLYEVRAGRLSSASRFAVAGGPGGAAFFRMLEEGGDPGLIDQVSDIRATAVDLDGDRWIIGGESLRPDESPGAVIEVREGGTATHRLPVPGPASQIIDNLPGWLLVRWDEGLTLIRPDGSSTTFAGRFEPVQLGAGWDDAIPGGELIVRFTGKQEWWVLEVR